MFWKLLVYVLYTFCQQITNGFMVQIKGGAVDACRFTNLFYRDVFYILLFQKFQKCLVHSGSSIKIFAFRLLHPFPPSSLILINKSTSQKP